mmetsp:Transcript_2018/g.3576  ORF Transcript_2018/g.3576 Transcript_2018/m.3576 type:complete len:415 (+) Transcript_2018:392-1636(+)
MNNLIQNYAEFGVEAIQRFKIENVIMSDDEDIIKVCEVTMLDDQAQFLSLEWTPQLAQKTLEVKKNCLKLIELHASISKSQASVLMSQAIKINQIFQVGDDGSYKGDPVNMVFMAASIIKHQTKQERQKMLEINCFSERLAFLEAQLEEEMKKIQELVKRADQYNKMDREERKEAIMNVFKKINSKGGSSGQSPFKGGPSSRMGKSTKDDSNEVEKVYAKLKECTLPEEAQSIVDNEIKKLRQLDPRNQEYHVSLNYLTTLSKLPWNLSQEENLDPKKAQEILDRDHFGLEQIKTRIIQFLAVRKLKNNNRGSILCFFGPPGVGKTSLGKSIAESMNRKFYKISLGGVRDEAEIRGHRRTYVGSMPGVIVQSLTKIKTNNPVFLLDEIDKMGTDSRGGDPGAALLEVLDPSQNS